jgi:hypothetical protein
MTISSDMLGEVENFKYLGSFVQKDWGYGMDIEQRIKCGWVK